MFGRKKPKEDGFERCVMPPRGFGAPSEETVRIERKLRRRPPFDFQAAFPIIGAISLFILFLCGYALWTQPDAGARNAGLLVVLLLGAFCFLPVGVFIGWVVMDTHQRAKVMRTLFKRNYGIVNFVSKGKQIISRVKDFDFDLLFVDNGLWILSKNRIYRTEKRDGAYIESEAHPLNGSDISFISGIPTIFLDVDTMMPLKFEHETSEANPIDLGSTLRGWLMNQLAKNMFFKNTFTIMTLLTIGLIAIVVYLSWQNYSMVTDLHDAFKAGKFACQAAANVIEQGVVHG
jgi:hypothetical protein